MLFTAAGGMGPAAWGQGYPPDGACRPMRTTDGFEVTLFASEPQVRQCTLVKFDDRGRLWVIQYLQYPNPAGLTRVEVDRYSRTIYDRIPEPPPRGPQGADRLTILEDTDRDGRADRCHDFVSDLNLCTGLEFGYGGVYVLQPPYLLFYPDRNRDDVPDGDPEVLLAGFGMEDAQAMANHLTWGPDGWLYGLNGSTTTCQIRGIEFQQGVWRYHPVRHEFELFCEGGGNCFGLTFDADGQLFYSSNGSRPAWHAVQGAYYHKQFDKHGGLHNPYALGYLQFVPHENYRGGHVTCGGTIYLGDTFPAEFRGAYIATNLLSHEVHWHRFFPTGSTFRSRREGELLIANDTWSAMVDLCVGPDGAVYIPDFYDRRTAHPDPDADWDRSNGRVYRIQARGAKPAAHVDLNQLTSDQLVDRLADTNDWHVQRARRLLAERRDAAVLPRLQTIALESGDDRVALQALWALYVSGGWNDTVAARLLGHRSPAVRYWSVRFLGDRRQIPAEIGNRLLELAREEPSPVVRSQLATSAKRLPADDALAIVWQLAQRNEDLEDPFIPLLLWWAVEAKADRHRPQILARLASPDGWQRPLVRDVILTRLMQRCAMEASADSLADCGRLLNSAASAADRNRMLASLDEGLGGRRLSAPPAELRDALAALGDLSQTSDPHLLRLAVACGSQAAEQRIRQWIADPHVPTATRVALVHALGQRGDPSCVPDLLGRLLLEEQRDVEIAALRAVARFDDDRIPARILAEYARYSDPLKGICRQALFSRPGWALAFLNRIDQGQFDAKQVPVDDLRGLDVFHEAQLDELIRKHWGKITRGTPEEKLADIRRWNNDLRAASGKPTAGRALFKEHCGKCHKLFGEGETIGPDLTTANRRDRQYMLTSIVDPSSFIRVEYLSVQIVTDDGRVLSGLVTQQTPSQLTLVDSQAQTMTIATNAIEEMIPSQISQMPEDVLKKLSPEQLRDLFAYLESDGGKE